MVARIVVLGSLNMDLVVRVQHLPAPGETLTGHSFFQAPGGKGANQAVAAARLGAAVQMVGRVGDDPFGTALLSSLGAAHVGTDHVSRTPGVSTGLAFIFLDDSAENVIVLEPGANGLLQVGEVDAAALAIRDACALLMQLEVPLDTVIYAALSARAAGVHVVLNAAPARPLGKELLGIVDTLVVNEAELAAIAGPCADLEAAASALLTRGPREVLVTLGREGCLLAGREGSIRVPAFQVDAVDTTAAGDTFTAAYAVALLEGRDPKARLRFASASAAVKVTRAGAQPGMPSRSDVEEFLMSRS